VGTGARGAARAARASHGHVLLLAHPPRLCVWAGRVSNVQPSSPSPRWGWYRARRGGACRGSQRVRWGCGGRIGKQLGIPKSTVVNVLEVYGDAILGGHDDRKLPYSHCLRLIHIEATDEQKRKAIRAWAVSDTAAPAGP